MANFVLPVARLVEVHGAHVLGRHGDPFIVVSHPVHKGAAICEVLRKHKYVLVFDGSSKIKVYPPPQV